LTCPPILCYYRRSAFKPISSENYKDKLIKQHKEILEEITRKVEKINVKTRVSSKLLEGRSADKMRARKKP
jgi:hypothetical protein